LEPERGDGDMDEVREFNREHGLALSHEHRVLDLVSETGELSKEVLKASDYGERDVAATDDLVDEFGDVYYCLLSLADELDVDPEAALAKSLEKYRERADGDVGSGR
jgi:NTP pyrophosphatase (non-canonical NTP hydrolase)